jgi:RNA polymerase sigma-70 factor (ECF subfamily)
MESPEAMEAFLESQDWSRQTEALRRMARALVGDESAGDDALQSAYLAALERPPAHFTAAWFWRVVRSRALDARRKGQRRNERSLERLSPDEHPAQPDLVERLEVHRVVAGAVQELPDAYRRVVYLRYFEGLSPAEIAQRLDMPVKTVKTRLHRALTRLRERLGERYGERGVWTPMIAAAFLSRSDLAARSLGTATVAGGVGLMAKKILIVAAGLLVALGVVRWWPSGYERGVDPVEAAAHAVPAIVDPGGEDLESPQRAAERVTAETAAKDTPVAAPTGGTVLVHVFWSDTKPAPGVGVHLRRNADGLPQDGLGFTLSDAHGVARFAGVPNGRVGVASDRNDYEGSRVVDVEAGRETSVELHLSAGLAVEGLVVDANRVPVAEAGIWLTTGFGDWTGGRVVATSSADGSFRLRDVPARQSLGALAAGYEPSELLDLETVDTSRAPVRVELVLATQGAALHGRVTGPDGEPVPGALVSVGPYAQAHSGLLGGGGAWAEVWTPLTTRTDAHGDYELRGLPIGPAPLRVRTAELPIGKREVELLAGESVRADVALVAGAVVAGTVRGADGEPIAHAIVRAFDQPINRHFLQGGQYDYDDPIGYPSTAADEHGSYRLTAVPPGEVHLFANPAYAPIEPTTTSEPHAETVLTAGPGEHLDWNPILTEGRVIEGLVTYRDGTPMPRVFVSARSVETGVSQALVADEAGRFRFLNLDDVAYVLGVQYWAAPADAEPIELTDVYPDKGLVRLRASYDAPVDNEPGTVSGTVHDAGERCPNPERLSVELESDRGFVRVWVEMDGYGFSFPDVEPGRYRPIAGVDGDAVFVGDWFELGSGEDRDLGVLTTVAGGELRLRAPRTTDTEHVELRLFVRTDGTLTSREVKLGRADELLVENLSAGELDVRAYGEGVAPIYTFVTIEADREVELVLALRPAVDCPIELMWPESATLGRLDVRVEDASGEVVWDRSEINVGLLDRPYVLSPPFPLGHYVVVAETKSGLWGRAELEVSDLAPERAAVRVELR